MPSLSDLPSQLVVLIILLPGFITFFVERALAYQNPCQAAELVAKSLVYSLLTFVCAMGVDSWCFHGKLNLVSWSTTAGGGHSYMKVTPQLGGVALYVAMAFVLGLAIGLSKTHDWHMWLARGLRLTKRTGQVSTWLDVFHRNYPPQRSDGPYVTVTLKDGRQVIGYPEYFSDEYHEGPVLFLVRASWRDDQETVDIPAPGILLCGASIECVQLYGDGREREDEEAASKPAKPGAKAERL